MNELILVVDDSALMRKHIGDHLKSQGYRVEIARNGEECLEKIERLRPHALTLDINMPVMDGLTCLSHIMERFPTPTVMLSSLTKRGAMSTIEAIQLGAVDYVCKPSGTVSLDIASTFDDLSNKIKVAIHARIKGRERNANSVTPASSRRVPLTVANMPVKTTIETVIRPSQKVDLVLVGVSTGGPSCLEEVLVPLPADFSAPIVVAQHMPATFTQNLARRLDGCAAVKVEHLDKLTHLRAGTVYIAQGDCDVVVQSRQGRLHAQPVPSSKEHLWHPSVSRMVDSAMRVCDPKRTVAVQLTGMGNDGAHEMARLKEHGGHIVAESQDTAVVFGMPQELIKLNGAHCVLPNHKIAQQLVSWVNP